MKKFIVYCSLMLISCSLQCRSARRPKDPSIPVISVQASSTEQARQWYRSTSKKGMKSTYQLSNPYLRINPIQKAFNQTFFDAHYLPMQDPIEFRQKNGSIDGAVLDTLAQNLVAEIRAGKKEFTDFKIIKDRDFNYKTLSGLIVVKYKEYPFIIKLAIEHPHTLIEPYSKSIESKFIFIFGGNFRHLSNFTRISNLETIKKIIRYNPYYIDHLDMPRKWYWKPIDNYDLEITWHASPYHPEELFKIPSIYAVISDYIDINTSYPQQELNKMAIRIAIDTEFLLDPHAGNTVAEFGQDKYVLLDTENFRLMTGQTKPMQSKKYLTWFIEMSTTCLGVYAGRTKQKRIQDSFSYTFDPLLTLP